MSKQRKPKAKSVREPLQVYLTRDERAMLDRLSADTGLSRAEVLRRGMRSFAVHEAPRRSPMLEFMLSIKGADLPPDMGVNHDKYLAEAYLDNHEDC
ncbi:MAG: hypothetical protein ACE5HT_03425 [Gemmatimonadales bacterium]